ncbi:MAG: hypothetical protein GY795_07760 [Desulfobacterales bacterium]|nr:hypothetical protein [Desulfobacterales bacterium]
MEINRETISRYSHEALKIRSFFGGQERWCWPGPFPPKSNTIPIASDLREERRKMISRVCQRLPSTYADRILFTHCLQIIVNRSLFPWINLFSDDLLYFEMMLHMEPEEEYYRDHYVHPLEVGCIGEQLINEVSFDGTTLGKKIIDSFKKIAEGNTPGGHSKILQTYLQQCNIGPDDIDEDWLKAAWWLCALYHDIGYFIQKSGHLIDERMSRSFPFGRNRLMTDWNRHEIGDELVWRQVESWTHEENKNAEYYKYFKSFKTEELLSLMAEKDHPAIGALSLSALSRKLLQYKSLSRPMFCAFQVASHAIFCHDHTGLAKYLRGCWNEKTVDKPIYHLDYWDNPLAALLIISDHISEFNRERLEPVKSLDNRGIIYESTSLCKGVKIEINGQCMYISFIPEDKMTEGKLFSDHFKGDKQWFLPCKPSGRRKPYLKLDKNVFDILVKLPIKR